jgi:two-component SAPR family response regulator
MFEEDYHQIRNRNITVSRRHPITEDYDLDDNHRLQEHKQAQVKNRTYKSDNSSNAITTKRIMIINHDDDINFSIKLVLEEIEYEKVGGNDTATTNISTIHKIRVYPFSNPYLAMEHFKPQLYDLVLIDIIMPKMNGFELYYKIRESDDKVNICFLTAGEIYEEISKQIFPNEPFNTREEKIHFIGIPIANEDLVKQVKEVLGLP